MPKKYKYKILQETVDEALLLAIKEEDLYARWQVKWQECGYDWTNLSKEEELNLLHHIIRKRFRLKKDTILEEYEGCL